MRRRAFLKALAAMPAALLVGWKGLSWVQTKGEIVRLGLDDIVPQHLAELTCEGMKGAPFVFASEDDPLWGRKRLGDARTRRRMMLDYENPQAIFDQEVLDAAESLRAAITTPDMQKAAAKYARTWRRHWDAKKNG